MIRQQQAQLEYLQRYAGYTPSSTAAVEDSTQATPISERSPTFLVCLAANHFHILTLVHTPQCSVAQRSFPARLLAVRVHRAKQLRLHYDRSPQVLDHREKSGGILVQLDRPAMRLRIMKQRPKISPVKTRC